MMRPGKYPAIGCYLLLFASHSFAAEEIENTSPELQGREIMERVYQLHEQYPYVYEEQSIVLMDHRGRRNTRKAKRYSRMDEDGSIRFLLTFDSPSDVKGVSILAKREKNGQTSQQLYLPALGEQLVSSNNNDGQGKFLGTDFSVECLTGEDLDKYQYARANDIVMEHSLYFALDVFAQDDAEKKRRLKRHYIRQDNFFITRIDYFDRQGQLEKQQTFHDIKPVNGSMWRANMILLHDYKEQHQSLIKIDKRIFSLDYVPEEIFTAEWLYDQFPFIEPETHEDDFFGPLPEPLENSDTPEIINS